MTIIVQWLLVNYRIVMLPPTKAPLMAASSPAHRLNRARVDQRPRRGWSRPDPVKSCALHYTTSLSSQLLQVRTEMGQWVEKTGSSHSDGYE